jgi:hypothetical protein
MNMGILDKIFGKSKPKEKEHTTLSVDELVDRLNIKTETVITTKSQTQQLAPLKLDLSKRIGLNFEKMNLDKSDVLEKTLFLLDISGSMDSLMEGKHKIDHLRDIMSKYPNAKMVCFSSKVATINSAKHIPNPNGSTNLALALTYAKMEKDESIQRIVLVSDGEPDDKNLAFKAAESLALPIDIIFIGNKGTDAEVFMEQLAKVTNGNHFIV